jgi:O-antigen ligase
LRTIRGVTPLALLGFVALACGVLAARSTLLAYTGIAVVAGSSAAVWALPRQVAVRTAAQATQLRASRVFFLVGLLLVGQLIFRPVLGLTGSDLCFLAALVLTLTYVTVFKRREVPLPSGVVAGAALFAVGACISAFSSHTLASSMGVTVRFLYLTLVWLWLATVVLRRVSDVRLGASLWVVSISISGLAAIAQLVYGNVIPDTDLAFGRMTGTAQHVSDLGGSAAVALPVAAALALHRHVDRRVRLVGAIGACLIVTALLLSGSVGGMIAAVAGVAVAACAARRTLSFLLVAALMAVAGAVASHLQMAERAASGTLLARIGSVTGSSGTFGERVNVYRAAWSHIANHLFVGVGFGFDPRAADAALPDLVHNAFLSVWYQGGLIAVVGLLIMSLSAFRSALAEAAAATGDDRLLGASLAGAFASYLVFGLGEPTLYVRYGWTPAALALALRAERLRSDRRPERARARCRDGSG